MGISIWQLLIVLAIIVLLFGTKKLRNIGGDLGSAIKNFKKSVKEGEGEAGKAKEESMEETPRVEGGNVIDAEVKRESSETPKEKQG